MDGLLDPTVPWILRGLVAVVILAVGVLALALLRAAGALPPPPPPSRRQGPAPGSRPYMDDRGRIRW